MRPQVNQPLTILCRIGAGANVARSIEKPGANTMHVSALMRRAPVRVLRITFRRLARRSLSAFANLRRKSRPSEPVRTFSVPSGFSSARPSLTIALTATALLACSTAALGTLLTSGWTDPHPDLPGRTEALALVEQMQTG